jgi:pilus assembly protein TadC
MAEHLLVFLFALAGGFAFSGIVANIYRLLVPKAQPAGAGRVAYFIVMVVAGPTVLFDNAARSWRKKSCSALAFWLAAALSAYWSFIIGLFGLNVVLAL